MKLRIKYETTTGKILSWQCVSSNVVRNKDLASDEIYVEGGDLSPDFYRAWTHFAVIDGDVLPTLVDD